MRKQADIKGTPLVYYRKDGQGAPVVLLHGWGCRAETLESVARTVRAMGRPLINVDFPGFGDSPAPPQVWSVYDYAEAIEELLHTEGFDSPDTVMLGHSFGGRVGIIYASRNPLGKLILVDAAGVRRPLPLKKRIKQTAFKTLRRAAEAILGRKRSQPAVKRLRRLFGSADYAGAAPQMQAIMSRVVNEDLRHLMPSITAPTLLIWGEKDTATPLADAKEMERLIPGAALVSFPSAGHYSFLDNPAQFAAVLKSFLNS